MKNREQNQFGPSCAAQLQYSLIMGTVYLAAKLIICSFVELSTCVPQFWSFWGTYMLYVCIRHNSWISSFRQQNAVWILITSIRNYCGGENQHRVWKMWRVVASAVTKNWKPIYQHALLSIILRFINLSSRLCLLGSRKKKKKWFWEKWNNCAAVLSCKTYG